MASCQNDYISSLLHPIEVIDDPEKRAKLYFEKHMLTTMFQEMTENLANEKPQDPYKFMLNFVKDEMIKRRNSLSGKSAMSPTKHSS